MNILFITPRFPYPPIQGDRMRAFYFLRELSTRHSITLASPGELDTKAYKQLPSLCKDWVSLGSRGLPTFQAAWKGITGRLPIQTLIFSPSRAPALLQHLLNIKSFDALHVQTARIAPAAEGLQLPGTLDYIDALSLNMLRRAEHEAPLRRIFLRIEGKRMQHYEQVLAKQYRHLLVTSADDYRALGSHKHLHIVPIGVDAKHFFYSEEERDEELIVLSGRMAYFPNNDAAHFAAQQILPLLQKSLPKARLRIVGADPPANVQNLAKLANVEVTGYVEDIGTELRRATVALAPLRTGTGMQTKVLEAMASGTPVVTTPHALRGLQAQPGQHLLVGNTAQELALQIEKLMHDRALQLKLAQAARHLIEQNYTWKAAASLVEKTWEASSQ